MTRNELKQLLPTDKIDSADEIIAAGFPAVEPILYELLEWTKDFNWPVAQELAPFLQEIGMPLVPHLRRILASDDGMWKYWILHVFVAKDNQIAQALKEELNRIATRPSDDEIEPELDVLAREILAKMAAYEPQTN